MYCRVDWLDDAILFGSPIVERCLGRGDCIALPFGWQSGWVDIAHWRALDRNLDDLVDAQGGTERIKNTPMPKQYDYFPQLFVQMYCVMLPLALVENMGWYTPLGSTLVGFIFLALDKIGRDLEYPFDNTIYDVPMTALSTTIEINLRQLLGETVLPQAETPVHGVLW